MITTRSDRVPQHCLDSQPQGYVLECTTIGSNLRTVIGKTIARLIADDWRIEGDALCYKPRQAQLVIENLVAGARFGNYLRVELR